jgi:hypothetical protein
VGIKASSWVWMAVLGVTAGGGLTGCGGGGGGSDSGSGDSGTTPPTGLTTAQRAAAATQTANSNSDCTAVQPFYWEIGDETGALASGSTGSNPPTASTPMLIASASKWFFGAYMLQLRSGNLTSADIQALTMSSGYTNFSYDACIELNPAAQDAETVDQCFHANNLQGTNADLDPNAVGYFYYNGGHFQKYADVDLGLGADNSAQLTGAVAAQVGQDISFSYNSPQLAGGIDITPAEYGVFLRKILSGELLMHDYLGTHAVCTNPTTCATALYTPGPSSENWHYSLAHWVEDDPNTGDGSFSSAGAFGFYPWIDASKTYYGILARYSLVTGAYIQSVYCGRTIRKAWMTGVAQ